MATNKKITELTELTGADIANDDVLAIVDISAGTTHKIKKSTFTSAVSGVTTLTATTPLAVDAATGDVTVSTGTIPVASGGTGATTASAAATALGVGTGDSPQFTAVNIGAATDTTVARASAGDINVEGNLIYRAGGTDVPVTDGGTGASSASAAATALGVGTGDSPQFTAVNIGAATDTTLARSGAGDLTVEGNALYRAGGTDVAIADGGTGASTLTANNVIMGNGTSALQFVAPSTSGNVLTSNGSTWASTAAAGGGAWNFISATTCTGETEVDFTLTSTYKTYIIVLSAVGGTIGSFLMRLSTDGGSSFDDGDNYRSFRGYNYSQDTASREDGDGGGGAPSMKLGVIETGTDNSFSGILYIAGHQQTDDTCTIFGRYVGGRTDQSWQGGWFFGGYEPTTNVDAIRLYPSTTSFTHGRISLFGLTTA